MNIKNIFNKYKNYRKNEIDINMNELNEIRRTNRDSIVLDVRSSQEFSEGHLNRSHKYTIV